MLDVRAWREPDRLGHRVAVTASLPEPSLPIVQVVCCDRRVRDGLCSVLGASARATVPDPIDDPSRALEVVGRDQPSAIVVDLAIAGGGDAPAFLAALRDQAPGARILVIGWNGESDGWVRSAGADGILHVDGPAADLVDAIVPGWSAAG